MTEHAVVQGSNMPSEMKKMDFTPIDIPQVRRSPWGLVKVALVLVFVGGVFAAWQMGFLTKLMGKPAGPAFQLVEVDRGDIEISVVETGTVESANNATLRCKVEALLGTVGGQGSATGKAGAGAGAGGQGGSAGAGGAAGGSGASGASGQTAAATTTKKASASTSATTSAGGTTASAGTSSTSSTSSTAGSSSTSTTASATGTTTTGSKPVIRSFTTTVARYVSPRPITAKPADNSAAQKKAQQAQGGGGGGGGGGGRGGGGGGGGRRGGMQRLLDEAGPGATTIVYLIPEGSQVKAGELLCKLDSASYEDEADAQKIRYIQAESYVKTVNSTLEVAKISLREYRDGIYPQDVHLIERYIESCELDCDRLLRTSIWSRDMFNKNYRTDFQVKADVKAYEQSKIALNEALNMYDRLTKHTGPKLIKALEANVRAIEGDKFTQEAAFNLEKQRLERLEKNIKNCELYAPTDGIVVYVNQATQFGTVLMPISEAQRSARINRSSTCPTPSTCVSKRR